MTTPYFLVRAAPLLFLLAAGALPIGSAASDAEPPPLDPGSDPRLAAKQRVPSDDGRRQLTERPDRKRTEDPIEIPVFGRPLTIEGRYSVLTRYEPDVLRDFDFSRADEERAAGKAPEDDQLRHEHSLELDLLYPFAERISAYANGQVSWRGLLVSDQEEEDGDWIWERKEIWLYLAQILDTPVSFQVGQQNFSDEREWWWDQDLDAVRLHFDRETLHLEAAVSEQLFAIDSREKGIDPEEEDLLRLLFSATWEWRKKHEIGLYVLHQDDHSGDFSVGRCDTDLNDDGVPDPIISSFFLTGCIDSDDQDESDADVTTLGVSSRGRFSLGKLGRLTYWADGAVIEGRERFFDFDEGDPKTLRFVDSIDRHDVSGFGFDVGTTWRTDLPLRPSLTVGYAFGSGRRNGEKQGNQGFRQTGLQDNNHKFSGVASFRYYGELLDPELSNLRILTLGFGFRFLPKSSLDVVYHRYRQHQPTDFLRGADVKRDPNGTSRDIGEEWDVILGIEEWGPLEIKAVGAVFLAGKAFGPDSGARSYLGLLRLRLNF